MKRPSKDQIKFSITLLVLIIFYYGDLAFFFDNFSQLPTHNRKKLPLQYLCKNTKWRSTKKKKRRQYPNLKIYIKIKSKGMI
jgi:hypothetical protein